MNQTFNRLLDIDVNQRKGQCLTLCTLEANRLHANRLHANSAALPLAPQLGVQSPPAPARVGPILSATTTTLEKGSASASRTAAVTETKTTLMRKSSAAVPARE